MRRLSLSFALLALMLVFAVPAMAVLTLPIADDATTEPGLIRIGGGVTLESDMNMYGARFTYGLDHGIALFGGGGLVDPDGLDSEPFVQLGGQFQIPLDDVPFDLAVRAGFGYVSFSDSDFGGKADIDILNINVGGLVSYDLEPVIIYGYGGLSYMRTEYEFRTTDGKFSDDDSDTEPAFGGGVLFPVNQQFSLYGELMHIDDLFFSVGAQVNF